MDLLDKIKDLGFKYATLAGLSFGLTDLKIPAKKAEIIDETEKKVSKILKNYNDGVLTEGERYNQVIDAWTNARVAVTNEMMRGLKEDTREDGTPYLNPIYLMTDSGARGSTDQIQQLAGMRALMAKPSGEIIETPIKSNFREGLTVLEYFSSTHGARKGLGRYRPEDGQFGLSNAKTHRRSPKRHHHRARLSDLAGHYQKHDKQR